MFDGLSLQIGGIARTTADYVAIIYVRDIIVVVVVVYGGYTTGRIVCSTQYGGIALVYVCVIQMDVIV